MGVAVAVPLLPAPVRAALRLDGRLRRLGIAATILVPLVTRAVIDGPIADSDRRGLYALGAAAIALGIVEALLMFFRRWVVSKATLGVETDVRVELYAQLQRLPMLFHSRWESGQLLSRMMSDLSTIRRFLGFGMVFIVVNIAQIPVVVAILIHLYWPLGLVVLASTMPVIWVSMRTEKVYTRLSRAVQDETGDVASAVEEMAHGLRVTKSFGRFDHIVPASTPAPCACTTLRSSAFGCSRRSSPFSASSRASP